VPTVNQRAVIGVVAALCVTAAAGIGVMSATTRGHGHAAPPISPLSPTTVWAPPPVIRTPPPPFVGLPRPPDAGRIIGSTPPPEAGITAQELLEYDRQFIINLQARSWLIVDAQAITRNGHRVCALLERGWSPEMVGRTLHADYGLSEPVAASFIAAAMFTYPSCPA